MKVIFTFGGLPHYYNYVLNRLNKLPGYEVKVIIPSGKSSSLGKGVHQTSKDIDFGIIELGEEKRWYGKHNFKNLIQVLKKEKPDILVVIWPYVLGFVLLPGWYRTIKKLGIKLVYKDIPFNIPKYNKALKFYRKNLRDETRHLKHHNWGISQKLYYLLVRELIKKYLNKMDAHVYYTEEAYDIIPTYAVPREKIHIIYNSPDTDRLFSIREEIQNDTEEQTGNVKQILHVGRLVAWKNVDLLIEAFDQVQKKIPQSRLIIIGTGPEKDKLQKLAKEKGISDKVSFEDGIYDEKILARYFLASSVYVLAGMGGISINDAMCFGKPVICSRADGTEKKLVRAGYNGYYFEENNAIDLADKIVKIISDPEIQKKFGENSTNIIKNEINIHTVISRYKKAFEYALNA